ncbi:MAG: winged helix DNA-binding protein [Taibaiella sp.]|nr:winged helix DNA-binding protein [Taibaiella sp.]
MILEEAIKTSHFSDETHKATINVMYTAYWLKDHLSKAIKSNGITIEQYNVLRILRGKHPEKMCIKDIAGRMIEKSSNVPRIIDRLLIKKLVKRTTSKIDKRETLISITQNGLLLLDVTTKEITDVTNLVTGLSEEEAAMLNTLLEKMRLKD